MAGLPPPDLMLESELFIIRRLVRGDASPKLESWIEDENAAAMLNTQARSWTVAQQEEFFARHEGQQRRMILGVFPKQERHPIGLIMVTVTPKQGVFVVSLLIGDKSWRGKDTTVQASEPVYDFFFNTLGYAKVKVNVRPENKAMIWQMHQYAWQKEAHLVKHMRLASSGERSDLFVYGMTVDERRGWHEKKARSSLAGSDRQRS